MSKMERQPVGANDRFLKLTEALVGTQIPLSQQSYRLGLIDTLFVADVQLGKRAFQFPAEIVDEVQINRPMLDLARRIVVIPALF